MENRKVYVGGRAIDQWGTFKRNKGDIIEKFKHEGKEYVLVKNFEGHYNKALMYQEENNSNLEKMVNNKPKDDNKDDDFFDDFFDE